MSSAIILIASSILIVIFIVVWLLHKAGFRVKEITAKAGPFKAKMERTTDDKNSQSEAPINESEIFQKASKGGVIHKSGITMSTQGSTRITQKANGKGSRIDESPIKHI